MVLTTGLGAFETKDAPVVVTDEQIVVDLGYAGASARRLKPPEIGARLRHRLMDHRFGSLEFGLGAQQLEHKLSGVTHSGRRGLNLHS
jgi:hypothetical protein